jgi:hypothetical protein
MAHPMKDKVKTDQQRADARYSFPAGDDAPESALMEAAKVTQRGAKAEDNFAGARSRQVSETGKVKK